MTVTCTLCQDRGYTLVPREGCADVVRFCSCRPRRAKSIDELVRALERAGMTKDEIRSAITPWKDKPNRRPTKLDELLAWAAAVARGVATFGQSEDATEPWSWLLWGKVGTGKSKAAAMAALEYVRVRGRGLVWVTSREAVELVMYERSTSDAHTSDTRDQILAAGLLVLDEFGTERDDHGGEVDFWISSRHRRGAPTIVVTNADNTDGIDGRIRSRLVTAESFEFVGVDYRRSKRRPQLLEQEARA